MATKTENLQLWKWAKTDPVDVEQINDNFGKVDTYLGKNGVLEKVAEFTVQSAAAEVDFNLSSLNLSSYSAIQLYFDLKFADVDEEKIIAPDIKFNDGVGIYETMADNSSSLEGTNPSMSLVPGNCKPGYGIAAKIELYRCGDGIAGMFQSVGYSKNHDQMDCWIKNLLLLEISLDELNKITIFQQGSNSNRVAANSMLRVYGVKK